MSLSLHLIINIFWKILEKVCLVLVWLLDVLYIDILLAKKVKNVGNRFFINYFNHFQVALRIHERTVLSSIPVYASFPEFFSKQSFRYCQSLQINQDIVLLFKVQRVTIKFKFLLELITARRQLSTTCKLFYCLYGMWNPNDIEKSTLITQLESIYKLLSWWGIDLIGYW